MADFIDVTKMKETREFFKPHQEEVSDRKKMCGWLILVGSVALAVLALGLWGFEEHFTQITGNEVLDPNAPSNFQSSRSAEEDAPASGEEGFLGKAKAILFGKNPMSEASDASASETASEANSKQAYQAKDMDIQSELQLSEYSIALSNVNLHIETTKHELKGSTEELILETGGQADIQGFTGTLSWKNNQLKLEGEMAGYQNANTEVRWKSKEEYTLLLEEGIVSIENAEIASLAGLSSGPIQIGNKLTLKTEKDELSLQQYRGSVTSELKNNQNTLSLKGHVG